MRTGFLNVFVNFTLFYMNLNVSRYGVMYSVDKNVER